jgi:elongation factor Ts
MEISAAVVKTLRDKTGAGMMDCKKALAESEGDMEKAIEYLRKKGAATAEKRHDRSANEGVVMTSVEAGKGFILEVNCETDFVARSEDFLGFAGEVMGAIKAAGPATLEALLEVEHAGATIGTKLTDIIGRIGEKIAVKRFASFATTGQIVEYIHPGAKLGVMIELSSASGHDDVKQLGKDLAMQVAAMSPVAIDRSSVPVEVREKELDIYRQQAREQGKPENMLDRIAEGKLNKYFQEYTLVEQSFIRDNTKSVKEHIDDVAKAAGDPIAVVRFERFQVGESN